MCSHLASSQLTSSQLHSSGLSTGMDVSEVSVDDFDEAERTISGLRRH